MEPLTPALLIVLVAVQLVLIHLRLIVQLVLMTAQSSTIYKLMEKDAIHHALLATLAMLILINANNAIKLAFNAVSAHQIVPDVEFYTVNLPIYTIIHAIMFVRMMIIMKITQQWNVNLVELDAQLAKVQRIIVLHAKMMMFQEIHIF